MNFIFPIGKYLTITQGFKSSHVGNDYGWNKDIVGAKGQPIIAVESGTVTTAVDGYGNTYPNSRIYGNYVIVSHGSGWYSLYGHLAKGITVKKGQTVAKGQTLGFMGNSGYSMGQHLHFELRKGGNSKSYAVDPLNYLAIEDQSLIVSDDTLYKSRIQYRKSSVGNPVAKNASVNQLEVLISNLNGRSAASVNADRLGYVTKGIYNIHAEQKAGDYTWYQIELEPEMWIAYSTDWEKLYLVEEAPYRGSYDVTFANVSEGDKNTLVQTGERLLLKYTVLENSR